MNRALVIVGVVLGVTFFAAKANATVYNIHFAGTCSNGWSDEAVNSGYQTVDDFGFWAGETTIDAYVDQRNYLSTAVSALKSVLDNRCASGSGNLCYIFTHSQGGAVVSKLLAQETTAWNIAWVAVVGNNEGGSELSSGDWLAQLVLGCYYAAYVKPSDNRPATGWNHNDTNGFQIRNFIGDIGAGHALWYVTSAFLPGDDDGVVAFHSAAGYSTKASYTDACGTGRWTNHYTYGTCSGYALDYLEIKRKHICYWGGGGSCP
jgi:hypothetical protein